LTLLSILILRLSEKSTASTANPGLPNSGEAEGEAEGCRKAANSFEGARLQPLSTSGLSLDLLKNYMETQISARPQYFFSSA
jgi:hypothetical protein